ncbi:MAG: Na+/H+ antiporter NhaA [Petrimonas mucosa]|jgi:NhaA family Na+:H+ antiporter|uniref:Na+/H+ antiporter NhaA n=1 Tax=Petrimonas TaxID=307628 RepID=UPI0008F12E86|nr:MULTISPECIES: Na+/H+ antiporter NhaA [Petrimonas]MDD3561190.1 Na+/H+ antiporter NhaA [Petrimonas mucosa]SFU61763.1 sodium/proton antiporter, NhaA family [Porphyromonadaceae bacterium KHP3R9]HHT28959.1 Na+/H+ antiporter NhaA [Petrimonas mucosa]
MTQHPSTTVTENRKFTITDFLHDSRAIGILLLLCTATSLILTNLPGIGENYSQFWETEIPFLHSAHLPHSILHVINDFLMALFFFQVGMEIKRETVVGELSSPSRMMMPMIAALFGVIFPAIIFLTATKGTVYQSGWAIPTATDIAFSLGILSLLGKAVPHSIKIFLTALAIIDDLCAILIIAFFYGGQPKFTWLLGVAASILIIILVIKYLKSPFSRILYLSLGMVMWYCMYQSGIHATFAGVILSALLPIKKIPVYEKILLFPVNFLIIPIFALANTSIAINASAIANLTGELSIGIVLGLLIGKPVGISLGVYLMTKMRIIRSKSKPDWMLYVGVGILAGIGFTMSIFVSTLAFEDRSLQDTAKLAVLIASTLSMIIGYAWLKIALKKRQVEL